MGSVIIISVFNTRYQIRWEAAEADETVNYLPDRHVDSMNRNYVATSTA